MLTVSTCSSLFTLSTRGDTVIVLNLLPVQMKDFKTGIYCSFVKDETHRSKRLAPFVGGHVILSAFFLLPCLFLINKGI